MTSKYDYIPKAEMAQPFQVTPRTVEAWIGETAHSLSEDWAHPQISLADPSGVCE